MSVIQIQPETLRAQARKVREYRTAQETTIRKLRNLVLSLSDSWKGEAQDAFVAKFQSMDTVHRRFAEVLDAYAKLMDTASTELENEDRRLNSMIARIG
jgi:WXG100 family type VII secretion target